jgi:hypothetical protein
VSFPLNPTRVQQLGEHAAKLEAAAASAVRSEIAKAVANGFPIARMDPETRQPYLEFQLPTETDNILAHGRESMKGKMWVADDFDAPLDDFKEYME